MLCLGREVMAAIICVCAAQPPICHLPATAQTHYMTHCSRHTVCFFICLFVCFGAAQPPYVTCWPPIKPTTWLTVMETHFCAPQPPICPLPATADTHYMTHCSRNTVFVLFSFFATQPPICHLMATAHTHYMTQCTRNIVCSFLCRTDANISPAGHKSRPIHNSL